MGFGSSKTIPMHNSGLSAGKKPMNDPIDDDGLHEAAAIGNRAHGHHRLQRRHGHTLANWHPRGLELAPLFRQVKQSPHFSLKSKTRSFAKTVCTNMFVHSVSPHLETNLGSPNVRGLRNDVLDAGDSHRVVIL